MKEYLRHKSQNFIQWSTDSRSGKAVCFPFINQNLLNIYDTLKDNDCKILYLPKVKDRFFDNNHLTFKYLEEKKELFNKYSLELTQFFIDNKVEYYVLDRLTNNDLHQHAALLGAKASPNTKIVYLDHGESGQYNWPSEVYWSMFADYYYAGNTDMKNYMKELSEKLNYKNVEIKEWKRSDLIKRPTQKGLLIFAPAFHCHETFSSTYSDTLKYQVRKHILFALEKLADIHNLQVIWKYMKDEANEDMTPKIIKNYKFKNIKYETRNNFNYWLSKAEMFVSDCVSTTFYDALDMRVKSLALWPEILMDIRPDVLKRFGEAIYIYSNIDDAIKQLQYFVANYAYISKVPHNPDSFPWEVK